jgi:hypothetical protein
MKIFQIMGKIHELIEAVPLWKDWVHLKIWIMYLNW